MSKNVKKELPKSEYGKQDTLQAIIFTDDFVGTLKPVERIYPSVLWPVVTAPLLDYLLETLVRSRVQQVFLYCSNHIEKLKAYIEASRDKFQDLVINTIVSDGCRSLGDALRDIDTKGCIRGDFILIRGTAFINADLQNLMDLHRGRKEKDKNIAMTMIFRDLGSVKDSALKSECSVVVSNANTRKLLYYKKFASDEKKVDLELEWFLEHDKVNINTALFDTHIYVCSQSVLPLFADNFDFQTMEDFIRGVLINEEFLDSRIYWEPLVCPAYALPITSWKTNQILNRDILHRQCYPLVPDTSPLSLRDFIYMSRSTYKHSSSTLSKGCTLDSESIVGESSTLGKNSFVKKSIIGTKCTIGTNVHINNSYIISDVIIEDDCIIRDSIIFSNCTLKRGTRLDACILLPNVKCTEHYSSTFIEIDDSGKLLVKKIDHRSSSSDCDLSAVLAIDDNEDLDNDGDASSSSSLTSAWSSPSTRDSPPPVQDDNEMFLTEVIDSLLRGYQDKLKCENLILEINSSRYAYNISIRQVSYNVIKAILNLPLLLISKVKSDEPTNHYTEYPKILRMLLTFFKPIIDNYIKTEIAQEDCLKSIRDVACKNQELILPYAKNILHFFYDTDILFEEKIIKWYEQDWSDNTDARHFSDDDDEDDDDYLNQEKKQSIDEEFRAAISPFIKWLQEAEEDSSGSS